MTTFTTRLVVLRSPGVNVGAEMSGESEVLQALQLACSQNPEVMKVGEKQLDSWKTEKNFYATLAGVFSSRSLDPAVRWMAITNIKNGVDQYWRSGAPNAISDEEKAIVRNTLLQNIEEPVSQVSNQMAVLTARIARLDCPEKWPNLLPVLSEGVRSQSEFTRKCYLNVLRHVIKSLSSRRLINHRQVFFEITTSLFVYMVQLWNTHLQAATEQLATGSAESAIDTLTLARICLKILRQMIVHGFNKFHAIIEALQFVGNVVERITALMQLRSQLPAEHVAVDILEKNILLKMKILLEVQSYHSVGYAPFVTPTLELIHSLLFIPENERLLFEKFTIRSLNLLRQILRCENYNPPRADLKESVPPPGVMEAHQAKLTFFKAPTCQQMLEHLVGHYLPLSSEELQSWEDSAEEFAAEKAGENYQYSLRACVESALCAFVHEFQQTVAPYLVSLIQQVQTTDATADFASLRLKEAVYKAVELCAFELYDDIDYDSWYQSQLLRELQIQDPRYKIVRHRVTWILGTWVTVKMSPQLRPSLYSVLVPLLARNEDLAIRLAAAEAVRVCVDDFDFVVDEFSPFLSDCTTQLFHLLLDCHECDTKMKVLNVLSLLMERMGVAIQPHVPALLQHLPQLWAESEHQSASMLRCVILSTLTNITRSLGPVSHQLHSFILPIIQFTTDLKQQEHVYLAEDGLSLWLTTLRNSPGASSDLLYLLGNMSGLLGTNPPTDESNASSMMGLMDIGSDNLEMCFDIMDTYIVLCSSDPDQFMKSCAEIIVRGCQYYVCDVKPEGVVSIVNVMAHLVQVYPDHFPPVIPDFLSTVIKNLLKEEDYPPTTSAYINLVGRVLIQNPNFFFTFLEQLSAQLQQTAAELFGMIIDVWSERMDSIANVQRRKLTGLAMANLLPLADVCVTSRFDTLINMCVEVLHDVMDLTEDDIIFDSLVTPMPSGEETPPTTIETEHDKREKQLAQFDPVRVFPLHKHITSKLEQCAAVHGNHSYLALMTSVDIVIREQLAEFIDPREMTWTLLALTPATTTDVMATATAT